MSRLMLSRVAESLYWTARYVERAEDVTRLLDVNFHALLDAQVEDRGAGLAADRRSCSETRSATPSTTRR